MISNKIVEKNKGILQCKSGGLEGFCIIHLTVGLNYLWIQSVLIFKHLLQKEDIHFWEYSQVPNRRVYLLNYSMFSS